MTINGLNHRFCTILQTSLTRLSLTENRNDFLFAEILMIYFFRKGDNPYRKLIQSSKKELE